MKKSRSNFFHLYQRMGTVHYLFIVLIILISSPRVPAADVVGRAEVWMGPATRKTEISLDLQPQKGITIKATQASVYFTLDVLFADGYSYSYRGIHLDQGGLQFFDFSQIGAHDKGISKVTVWGVSVDGPGSRGVLLIYAGDQSGGRNDAWDDFHPIKQLRP